MAITVKQGYLRKKGTSGDNEVRRAVKTLASLVYDSARSGQSVQTSLANMTEKECLGYPAFSTVTAYAVGDIVFYDRKLWKFTAAHAAGAWIGPDGQDADVELFDVKTALEDADATFHTGEKVKNLDIESTPTQNSNNLAKSGGIWAAIQNAISTVQLWANGIFAKVSDLLDGTIIPKMSMDLQSWKDEQTPVTNSWDSTIRTTAGDDPINTDDGGVLKGLSAGAGEDFIADAIATTGENQLRLTSDGGQAKSLNSDAARVIPVPHLVLGSFGSAEENNGMIFVGKPSGYSGGIADGGSDLQPTVRFVPLSDGEPSSASDGTAVTPTEVTYQDKTYHTYLNSGEGWFIVTPPSGVAWSDICARIAWEDWYTRFVSPTDPADATGDSVDLTAIKTALTTLNGLGKVLYLSPTCFTKAERTDETHMLITEPVGRVTSPSWTNTLQDDETTYLHTLNISGMKPDGVAKIEGSQQHLTVSGTALSYADANAQAISGAVRYELATPATQSVTLGKTSYSLNDCGLEIKAGAVGSGYAECEYVQNIPDALSQIAQVKLDSSLRVIAEALLELYNENNGLKAMLNDPTRRVNAEEYYSMGYPMMLSAAGAPNASVVPNEWNTETMGVWTGVPMVPGQEYFDTTNNKWYKAKKNLNGATADWLLLN